MKSPLAHTLKAEHSPAREVSHARREEEEKGGTAMFRDSRDEEKICQVLKAYVEEFGPENVIVALPKAWNTPDYSLGPTRLEFTTEGTIDVRVEYGQVQLSYQIELAA
jgi:hypothetical protein